METDDGRMNGAPNGQPEDPLQQLVIASDLIIGY